MIRAGRTEAIAVNHAQERLRHASPTKIPLRAVRAGMWKSVERRIDASSTSIRSSRVRPSVAAARLSDSILTFSAERNRYVTRSPCAVNQRIGAGPGFYRILPSKYVSYGRLAFSIVRFRILRSSALLFAATSISFSTSLSYAPNMGIVVIVPGRHLATQLSNR